MALPGELQAQYANDPGYQAYLRWVASGVPASWWSPEAAAAAAQAGYSQYAVPEGAHLINKPWGESDYVDASGQHVSSVNPQWLSFMQQYMSQHPLGQSSYAATAAAGDQTLPSGQTAGYRAPAYTSQPAVASPTSAAPVAPAATAAGGAQPPASSTYAAAAQQNVLPFRAPASAAAAAPPQTPSTLGRALGVPAPAPTHAYAPQPAARPALAAVAQPRDGDWASDPVLMRIRAAMQALSAFGR